MATIYFLSDACGLQQPFVRRKLSLEFRSLLLTSRPRCFPLRFLVGKMIWRSSKRIVTPHSLNAKITWLQY
jgi:hypothetical protein